MKTQEILNKISKGKYFTIEYKSQPKPAAAHKTDIVEKYVTVVARNVDYRNMAAHKDTSTTTLAPTNNYNGLEFYPNSNGIILHNKDYTQDYVRINTTNNPNHKPIVKWFLNGVETTKEKLQELGIMTNGYWSRKPTDTYNVKVENVIAIG